MAQKLYDRLYKEAQVELAKLLQGEERQIVRYYGTALSQCRKELEKIYKRYGIDGRLTNAEMSKYNRLSQLQDDISGILEKQLVNVDSMTRRLTGDQYQEAFYRHAYAIDQGAGMSLSWGQIPQDAVKAVVESPLSKLASSKAMAMGRKGTVDKVRDELALAVIRGDSYDRLSMRISDVLGVRIEDGDKVRYLDKGAAYRSMLVARTEGQRVLVDGQQAAYDRAQELGCEFDRIWDATLDGRTRPEHGALDGKAMDDEHKGWFVPSIGWVSGPLHSGVASFDINCRCRIVSQVKGLPQGERYARGDGVRPYCTYEQWRHNLGSQGMAERSRVKGDVRLGKVDDETVRIVREDSFRGAPAYIRRAVERADQQGGTYLYDRNIPATESSFYDPRTKNIHISGTTMGKEYEFIIRDMQHEVGHKVDRLGAFTGRMHHLISQDQRFVDCCEDVRRSLITPNGKPTDTGKKVRRWLLQNTSESSPQFGNMSDLFGALTENRIVGHWKHELAYYRNDPSRRLQEVFANCIDIIAQGGQELKHMKKWAPTLGSTIERLIREVLA